MSFLQFNWYARRVGLAGIYKAAELFYLTDSSPQCTSTRNFVASRIRDAELIQTALNLNPVAAAPQTLTAAFTTVRRIELSKCIIILKIEEICCIIIL